MGKIIGIDTTIFIYLLEANTRYLLEVENLLKQVEEGKMQGVFSCIGLIEILTGPKKQGRYDLAFQYKKLITHFPHLTIRGINETIIEIASDLRAMYSIATPDAIHLATAINAKAQSFVTNDKGLKKVKEISIQVLN